MRDPKLRRTPKPRLSREEKEAQRKLVAQAVFLVEYAQGNTVLFSAEQAKVSTVTIGEWRRLSPEFDAACDKAREDGTDALENILVRMAKAENLGALIYALKIRGRTEPKGPLEKTGYDYPFSDLTERAERVNNQTDSQPVNGNPAHPV